MLDLRVEVNGTQQVERKLAIMASHINNFEPAFIDIKNAFIRYQRAEFETEGKHGGYDWSPLTLKYAAWKQRHFPGRRILELTGDLRKSLTSKLQAVAGPKTLTMWSTSEVASYHQEGTQKMPARKIVAVPKTEKQDWARVLHRYVMANR